MATPYGCMPHPHTQASAAQHIWQLGHAHVQHVRGVCRPRGLHSRPVQAIQTLNPYNSAWLIKARLASKGQMRSFLRQGQPTSVFTIELVDAQVSLTT